MEGIDGGGLEEEGDTDVQDFIEDEPFGGRVLLDGSRGNGRASMPPDPD